MACILSCFQLFIVWSPPSSRNGWREEHLLHLCCWFPYSCSSILGIWRSLSSHNSIFNFRGFCGTVVLHRPKETSNGVVLTSSHCLLGCFSTQVVSSHLCGTLLARQLQARSKTPLLFRVNSCSPVSGCLERLTASWAACKQTTLTSCYLLCQSLLLGAALYWPREYSKWLESKPALVWADAVHGYCRLASMVWGCWYRRLSANRSRSPVKMDWSCWNSSNIFQKMWTPDLNMLLGNGFTGAIGTAHTCTTVFDAPFLTHF